MGLTQLAKRFLYDSKISHIIKLWEQESNTTSGPKDTLASPKD